MLSRTRSFLVLLGALGILAAIAVALQPAPSATPNQTTEATSTTQVASAANAAVPSVASSTPPTPPVAVAKKKVKPAAPPVSKPANDTTPNDQVVRIENPYPFAPLSFDTINSVARAALVNIVCAPRGGTLRPISASGVIIDPRGVILTNAHVAQYVLLSESTAVDLECVVRSGSPATAKWVPEVLYMPKAWVQAHAAEILADRPIGTGEYDYALLRIQSSVGGVTPTASATAFPYLPVDTREGIGFIDDEVLVASYPAEFIGGLAAQNNLYPSSSVTAIKDLLTFGEKTIDLVSLGGIIEAQSGSSGGAVVNMWGRLIGIITTTSEGATTAERDLHAITLSYIDRDMVQQMQFNLGTVLGGDVAAEAAEFRSDVAPFLMRLLIDQLQHRTP